MNRILSASLVLVAALVASVGCGSGSVQFDREVPPDIVQSCRSLAITVVNDAGEDCPPSVAENLQAAAIKQMTASHPGTFEAVRPQPTGAPGEVKADVHITGYSAGSRVARAILIGLGASKIATKVDLVDSPSGNVLASGDLSLTWAMGGAMGASKGIEDLVNDAGVKIADGIALQLGKTPSPQP